MDLSQLPALASPPPQLWDLLVRVLEVVVGALTAYVANGFRGLKKDISAIREEQGTVRVELAEWKVFLVGKTGGNGLNSRVVKLEEEWEDRLRGRRHNVRRGEDQ